MGVIVFGLLGAALCVLVLARYGTVARPLELPRDGRERMSLDALHELVVALLDSAGLAVVEEERRGSTMRLFATARDSLFSPRYVVFLEAAPPGDRVEPSRVLELKELVRAEPSMVGLLVTPYAIDLAGLSSLEAPLRLIDGYALRRLVAERLPERLDRLTRYRGVGEAPLPPEPLRPQAT
jgi:hypothetical protein